MKALITTLLCLAVATATAGAKEPKSKDSYRIHDWSISASQDKFDDTWSVVSVQRTSADASKFLFFLCEQENRESLGVNFDKVLAVANSPIEVKFRFDKKPVHLLQGRVTGDYQGVIFDENGIAELRADILDSKDLIIGAKSHTLTFDFTDANLALATHGEYCNWTEYNAE